jgi:hypothetical protein
VNISGRYTSGSTLGTTAASSSRKTSTTIQAAGFARHEGALVRPLAERRCGQLQDRTAWSPRRTLSSVHWLPQGHFSTLARRNLRDLPNCFPAPGVKDSRNTTMVVHTRREAPPALLWLTRVFCHAKPLPTNRGRGSTSAHTGPSASLTRGVALGAAVAFDCHSNRRRAKTWGLQTGLSITTGHHRGSAPALLVNRELHGHQVRAP